MLKWLERVIQTLRILIILILLLVSLFIFLLLRLIFHSLTTLRSYQPAFIEYQYIV